MNDEEKSLLKTMKELSLMIKQEAEGCQDQGSYNAAYYYGMVAGINKVVDAFENMSEAEYITISELEAFMKKHNLVIRAIPFYQESVYEAYHQKEFPHGEFVYIPEYGRNMLVVKQRNPHGGEFVFTSANHNGTKVNFTKSRFFKNIEDIVTYVKENA